MNQKKHLNATSIYKGVYFYKQTNKWRATIRVGGVCNGLGYFEREEEAAKAYNEAARRIFGEFAKLNVIN